MSAVASSARARPLRVVPGAIVVGAVCFNAALAVVNGNVTGLSQAPIVVAEVAFVGMAHLVALTHFRREMVPWYALLGAFAVFAVVRSLSSQGIDVKYLRDVMIIPTFVVLGLTFDARRLAWVFVTLQSLTLAFLLLEALDVDAYSNLFKIKDFYINTRGYTAEDFWNTGSQLYVSATRPDGSFLDVVALHRLSSIFLEPVSLGNYCMVVVAFLCACWSEIKRPVRWYLAATTAMGMIGCDGRLAMVSVLPMVLCCAIAPRMPRYSALVYIPGVLALAFVLVDFGHFLPGGDDFPSRIAHTVFLLRAYALPEFLGLSDEFMSKAVDSGIAYLVTTQSIFGVLAIWLTIALSVREDAASKSRIVHAAMIYVALNMMVSFALLTIKTGALLWLTYGSIVGRTAQPSRRAARRDLQISPSLPTEIGSTRRAGAIPDRAEA